MTLPYIKRLINKRNYLQARADFLSKKYLSNTEWLLHVHTKIERLELDNKIELYKRLKRKYK